MAPVEEMKIRIDSVLKARTDPNFFLLARTDAAADETQGMQEALRRARLYREWGADGVFISTPKSESDLIQIGQLGFPTAVCITEGSPTGNYSVADFERMGIQLAFFPAVSDALLHPHNAAGAERDADEGADEPPRGHLLHAGGTREQHRAGVLYGFRGVRDAGPCGITRASLPGE